MSDKTAGNTKIKVLHLIATNFVGGPEKQLLRHMECYDRSRYEIVLGSYQEQGRPNPLLEAAAAAGHATLTINHRYLMDFSIIKTVREFIGGGDIDVVVSHGYKSNIVSHLAGRGILLGHGMYVRGWTAENLKVRCYNRLERPFLRRADLVVTVARRKLDELETMGLPTSRLRYVANAVEIPGAVERPRVSLRDRYRLSDDVFLLVAAGRLSPEKGHRQLIQSLHLLKERRIRCTCVIFGDGPLDNTLRKMAGELGIEDTVRFAGFDPEWKSCLPQADLLINPSLSEVMPNVVMEAMAYGCPVMATDVGGVAELIVDNETGLLIPTGNPGVMADRIAECTENRDAMRQMALRAQAHMKDNFSFPKQAEKLQALYEELHRIGRTKGSNRGADI